ncbi:MAG: O-antigen ligase family protein [bacterium]|nr:O-antigen ligase family protein [bacterium]
MIVGSFIAFTINPGSLGDLMRICGSIILFNMLIGNYRMGDVTEGHLVFIGIFLIFLIVNGFMPDDMIHGRSYRYFLALPGMVLAIHCLSTTAIPDSVRVRIYSGIAVLSIVFQLIAYHTVERVVNRAGLESFSVYSNMHHFGSFAGMVLPVLFFFATQIKGWLRILCVAAIIVDFYLLWESSSRISWLAFFSSILIAVILFLRKKKLLIGLAGFVAVTITSALVSGLGAINTRIVDFLSNWRTDERATVWTDTLIMLGDNSVRDWILGHGIGSFRYYFPAYDTFKQGGKSLSWNFPHNIFFQIIFENGLIGLAAIMVGVTLLLVGLWRGYRLLANKRDQFLLVAIFILFLINFIHGTLTLSIYHKYFIYPLSMICGVALVLLEKSGQNRPLHALGWFNTITDFISNKMPVFRRWFPKPKSDT